MRSSSRLRCCKIRARGNGERNSAARIFRSSCSRSLEISVRPLWPPSSGFPSFTRVGPRFTRTVTLSLFLPRRLGLSLSPSLLRFLPFAPLPSITPPVLRLRRFLSVRALGFSIAPPRYLKPGTSLVCGAVASTSPWSLTDVPPRVAAVTRIHSHLISQVHRIDKNTPGERRTEKTIARCPAN